MPPIRLSRHESCSLRKISERPCLAQELPEEHAEKFLNYGLAKREAMLLRITPRGQVELLASGFRSFAICDPSRWEEFWSEQVRKAAGGRALAPLRMALKQDRAERLLRRA